MESGALSAPDSTKTCLLSPPVSKMPEGLSMQTSWSLQTHRHTDTHTHTHTRHTQQVCPKLQQYHNTIDPSTHSAQSIKLWVNLLQYTTQSLTQSSIIFKSMSAIDMNGKWLESSSEWDAALSQSRGIIATEKIVTLKELYITQSL